jgi:hypothetical protein
MVQMILRAARRQYGSVFEIENVVAWLELLQPRETIDGKSLDSGNVSKKCNADSIGPC